MTKPYGIGEIVSFLLHGKDHWVIVRILRADEHTPDPDTHYYDIRRPSTGDKGFFIPHMLLKPRDLETEPLDWWESISE